MSVRGFVILCLGWLAVCWLATTDVGAMLGFVFAIVAGSVVAPIAAISGLSELGIGYAVVSLYAVVILFFVGRGVWAWRNGRPTAPYGDWGWAVSLTGFAVVAVLSWQSLERSWH